MTDGTTIAEKLFSAIIGIVLYVLAQTTVGILFPMKYPYENVIFPVGTLLLSGVIIVAIGLSLNKIKAISNGLLVGGFLSIIAGATSYYFLSQTQLEKVIVLFVVFILLIIIGYLKFSNNKIKISFK